MPVPDMRSIYLTDDGIIGGTHGANVNGSVTPVPYYFQPSLNGIVDLDVYRLIVMIEDTGALAADNYGALGTLTNGIRVQHVSGNTTTNLDGGLAIKSHAHWARLCYDMAEHTFGSGANFVVVRWTFERAGIPLHIENTDQLKVTINDDLTGLEDHHFMIQGRVLTI